MDVNQAKAEAKAAGGRLVRAGLVLLGSRVVAAVACLFAIAFGMATWLTPERLPPLGGVSLVSVGLPPLELGKEKQILGDIGGAAQRQGGAEKARDFFKENRGAARIANWIGLGLALLVLGFGVRVQARQWRRGVRPF